MNPFYNMIVKDVIETDYVNYKKPSLFIGMPTCTFKCMTECRLAECQNSKIANQPNIEIGAEKLIKDYYLDNDLTKAVVFGGLEPLDSIDDLVMFIYIFRSLDINDDIVIYTGYTEDEVLNMNDVLTRLLFANTLNDPDFNQLNNLIIKFDRYKPLLKSRYDKILGVELISENQYAKYLVFDYENGYRLTNNFCD